MKKGKAKKTDTRCTSPLVGAHMSIAGGVWKAFRRGADEGCATIQIFTRNASRWKAPPLSGEDIRLFREEQGKTGIAPVFAHDSYLINLASPSPELLEKSRRAFLEELERAELLGLSFLVTHPGAHMGEGVSSGLARVAESVNWVHERSAGWDVEICLENTAGQGTVLGSRFGQFSELLSRINEPERIGFCLDTCHAFSAGYDLRREKGYAAALDELEGAVGKGRVRALHVNDAKGELGGRLDRHQHIGRGTIGLECFRLIMNDSRFSEVPKILETPKEEDGLPMDRVNLEVLRGLCGTERVPKDLLEKVRRRLGRGEP